MNTTIIVQLQNVQGYQPTADLMSTCQRTVTVPLLLQKALLNQFTDRNDTNSQEVTCFVESVFKAENRRKFESD